MHTRFEPNNPYECGRYAFAWRHVPASGAAHLDFGCGGGRFLRSLKSKQIKCLVGVDVSRQAIEQAQKASGGLEIMHIARAAPLPFPDGTFSSITLMDVLEHVHEQEELLDELHRVLMDDGVLIVTVPGRHAFSFLDMGNLKFRFPQLHRWYYCRNHSPQEYDCRYVSHPDGLIGDISAAKRWHEPPGPIAPLQWIRGRRVRWFGLLLPRAQNDGTSRGPCRAAPCGDRQAHGMGCASVRIGQCILRRAPVCAAASEEQKGLALRPWPSRSRPPSDWCTTRSLMW